VTEQFLNNTCLQKNLGMVLMEFLFWWQKMMGRE